MHKYERASLFSYTYISSLGYTKEVNEKKNRGEIKGKKRKIRGRGMKTRGR